MYEGFLGNILNIYIALGDWLFADLTSGFVIIEYFIPCAIFVASQIGGIYGIVKYILLFKECFEFRVIMKDVKVINEQNAMSDKDKAKLKYFKAKLCTEIDNKITQLKNLNNPDEENLYNAYQDIKSAVEKIPSLEEIEYFKWYYNNGELRSDDEANEKRQALKKHLCKKKYGYTYVFDAEEYEDEKIRAGIYLSLFTSAIVTLIFYSMRYGQDMRWAEFLWYPLWYIGIGLPVTALILGVTTFTAFVARIAVKKAYEDIGEKPPVDTALISTGLTAAIAAISPLIMFKRRR